ncbi:MAG: DUF6268 family outer membrane beta-barrel protein [Myxococcota bacterium]
MWKIDASTPRFCCGRDPDSWRLVLCAAAITFLGGSSSAKGQSAPIASIEYEEMLGTEISDSVGDATLRLSTIRVRGNVPLRLDDAVLVPGVFYTSTFVSLDSDVDLGAPDTFHELGVSLALVQPLSEAWSLQFRVAPSIATDFSNVEGDNFRIANLVLATHRFNSSFSLGFGFLLNYIVGELLPLPVLTVDWRPVPFFFAEVFLPQRIRVGFAIGDRVELGLSAQLRGNRYSVSNDNAPRLDALVFSSAHGGAFASVRLFSGLWLLAYGGVTAVRRFDLLDDDEELASTDLENGPILQVSLEFRPPRPSDGPEGALTDDRSARLAPTDLSLAVGN